MTRNSLRYIAVFLSLLIPILCLSGCRTKKTPVSVREMLNAYYLNQSADNASVRKALDIMKDTDPESAARWEQIMEYWHYANHEMPIYPDCLPDGLNDTNRLCIIVLGYALEKDGTMRTELLGRLQTALRSAQKYPNAYVLCTGGKAGQKAAAEADVMADWLAEQGIAEERLIRENQSNSTAENAIFSRELLLDQYPKVTDIAIVSGDYHIPWGAVLFEALFLLEGDDLHILSNAASAAPDHANYDVPGYQSKGLLQIAEYAEKNR